MVAVGVVVGDSLPFGGGELAGDVGGLSSGVAADGLPVAGGVDWPLVSARGSAGIADLPSGFVAEGSLAVGGFGELLVSDEVLPDDPAIADLESGVPGEGGWPLSPGLAVDAVPEAPFLSTAGSGLDAEAPLAAVLGVPLLSPGRRMSVLGGAVLPLGEVPVALFPSAGMRTVIGVPLEESVLPRA